MATREPNKKLKAAREHNGWSQKTAAKKIGIGESTYQNWEEGVSFPHPENRLRLCEIFRASMEELELLPPGSEDAPAGRIELEDASEYREDQNQYFQSHLASRLLSIVDAGTYTDQRTAFAQIMEQFDAMNTENQNYQITRRQAVLSLATFSFAPPIDLLKRERVAPSCYELFVKECGASLTACGELALSSDPDDLWLAFRCVCRYLVELKVISHSFSRCRTQALELAAHCAMLKTNLGWGRVGNAAVLLFAQDALALARESGNICLMLSAYSKLSWAYLYDDQRKLALDTATIAKDLLKGQKERLPVCIRGGTWSTLSVMQARNKQPSDAARKKAVEQGPDNQVLYGMEFTGGRMWMEQGEALYYAGKPAEALDVYAEIVNLDTMEILNPFKGVLTATQRIETILDMSRASTKGQARNKANAIRYWKEAIEGAKRLKCKSLCDTALTAYDLMDAAFPDEQEVYDLHDHIRNIDKSLK